MSRGIISINPTSLLEVRVDTNLGVGLTTVIYAPLGI